MSIFEQVLRVRETMHDACVRSGRADDAVRLVAVTKYVETARIAEAVAAGVTAIGENHAQEFTEKLNFYENNHLDKHFIGQLQTNKVKYICGIADLIQSVDRLSLLDAIASFAARHGNVQDVLIEVNIGDEPQKGGVDVKDVPLLIAHMAKLPQVRLRGLMCVPPVSDDETVRVHFRRMRRLFETIQQDNPTLPIDTLSMGMSHDYPVAIEEGATMVRVGSAIFGARNYLGGTHNG